MLGKLSDLLDPFSLIPLIILSLGFVFWDSALLLKDDLLVPIEF